MPEDRIYHKILIPSAPQLTSGKMCIVSLQSADEEDYDEDFWLQDDDGEVLVFDTYAEAVVYLNDNVAVRYIRTPDQRRQRVSQWRD